MTAQLTAIWVRVGDQWVRADHIVALHLEPPPAGAPLGGRWGTTLSQRLLVRTTLPADEQNRSAPWHEAAVCSRERGDVVVESLLTAIHEKNEEGLRWVYPARTAEGWVTHWQTSTTLPRESALATGPTPVPPITGTATVDRPRSA